MHDGRTTLLPKTVLFLAAALLLSAMAAHAFIPHEHPHFAFGEGIAAAQHGEERKLWFATMAATFAAAGLLAVSLRAMGRLLPSASMPDGVRHQLHEAFKRGILHAKICG